MSAALLAVTVAIVGLVAWRVLLNESSDVAEATSTLQLSDASVPVQSSAPLPFETQSTPTLEPRPTEEAPLAEAPEEVAPPVLAQSRTLRGTFQVYADRNPDYRRNCTGFAQDGLGDIHAGTQVEVTDAQGQTIGLGELGDCKFTPLSSPNQARGFRFSFTVTDLPDSPFYGVQVSHRGVVKFSKSELETKNWRVALGLD